MEHFYEALNKALKYLSFRARSVKEMKNYLFEKEFKADIIDKVVEYLIEDNLLNDSDFADIVLQSYKNRYGKNLIRQKLIEFGVASQIIDKTLNYSDMEGAEIQAQKYLKSREFNREKLWKYLYNRGFSSSSVSAVVSTYASTHIDP